MVDLTPDAVYRELQSGGGDTYFIDIRREEEVAGTTAEGARHIPRDMLEVRLQEMGASQDSRILLMCASGVRSRYAAQALRHFGFQDSWSLDGGFTAWRDGDYPLARLPYLDAKLRERFARHTSLAEIGVGGQARLADATVTVVGAGGLSCPAALYLASMGVGRLRIIDDDHVELSNLHRQVLHTEARVGKPKVESAKATLEAINSDTIVETHERKLDPDCAGLIADADVVVNGADNFKARYTLNDMCVAHGVPMIDGALLEMDGQLSVFCHPEGPCYRCLYPDVPPAEIAPSCAAAGVLGVVPGIVGALQALEAVKLIVGFGQPLIGQLLVVSAADTEFKKVTFERDPNCQCCSGASGKGSTGWAAASAAE